MRDIVQNVVFGVIAGGIYGMLALGIVLVYRGSRVLNFAQGEIGTAGLFLAYWLIVDHGLPWLLGAAIAIAAAGALGAGFERGIVRRMGAADRLSISVATIGLLTLILAVELRMYGESPKSLPAPVDAGGVEIAGVVVSPTRIIALVVTLAIALGLAGLLRRTDFGLGVLAAAQDPTATRLVGVPLGRVSAFTWGTGAGLSVLAALLIAPDLGAFYPGFASRIFLIALAAALVGGLTSLPGAFGGGLVVGILEAFVKDATLGNTTVPNLSVVAVFGAIIVVLLLRPNGVFARAGGRS